MSAAESTRFRASDRIHVDYHARQHWRDSRPDGCETRADVAWQEATPYPCGIHNALFLRHHEPSGWILIVVRTCGPHRASYNLISCIEYIPGEHPSETIRRAKAAIQEAEA